MTATPSTEQTRPPEEGIIATASRTELVQAVDAGGCGGACCAPDNATIDLAQGSVDQAVADQADQPDHAGCGCGCG